LYLSGYTFPYLLLLPFPAAKHPCLSEGGKGEAFYFGCKAGVAGMRCSILLIFSIKIIIKIQILQSSRSAPTALHPKDSDRWVGA